MGHFDKKNLVIRIKKQENITDNRYVILMKDWDFTYYDTLEWDKKLKPYYNATAEKIIKFFCEYQGGKLCPDKYNSFEPIKLNFDKNNLTHPIQILSFPAGTLHFRKKHKFDASIHNNWHCFLFDPDEGYKAIPPVRVVKEGEYLCEIVFWFSKSKSAKKIDMDFLKKMTEDFCIYLNTDYGIITDEETGDELFNVKSEPT